jgi:hypothetical protein
VASLGQPLSGMNVPCSDAERERTSLASVVPDGDLFLPSSSLREYVCR